jgi:deazaflavin-dependent oxidoreductase (nitroreductase family)
MDGHPNQLGRMLNRSWAMLHSAGLKADRLGTLEVAGRRTGRIISFPVVIADHEGDRYLVAMLGDRTDWVRNVEAAGGQAVLRHGRREEVHLELVAASARPPILRRYLEVAPGARPHFPLDRSSSAEAFAEVAARTPVFQVRTLDSAHAPH